MSDELEDLLTRYWEPESDSLSSRDRGQPIDADSTCSSQPSDRNVSENSDVGIVPLPLPDELLRSEGVQSDECMAFPADQCFHNDDEDFPTLSAILPDSAMVDHCQMAGDNAGVLPTVGLPSHSQDKRGRKRVRHEDTRFMVACHHPPYRVTGCPGVLGDGVTSLQGTGKNRCGYMCNLCTDAGRTDRNKFSQLVHMEGDDPDPRIQTCLKLSPEERSASGAKVRSYGYKCSKCRRRKVRKEDDPADEVYCECAAEACPICKKVKSCRCIEQVMAQGNTFLPSLPSRPPHATFQRFRMAGGGPDSDQSTSGEWAASVLTDACDAAAPVPRQASPPVLAVPVSKAPLDTVRPAVSPSVDAVSFDPAPACEAASDAGVDFFCADALVGDDVTSLPSPSAPTLEEAGSAASPAAEEAAAPSASDPATACEAASDAGSHPCPSPAEAQGSADPSAADAVIIPLASAHAPSVEEADLASSPAAEAAPSASDPSATPAAEEEAAVPSAADLAPACEAASDAGGDPSSPTPAAVEEEEEPAASPSIAAIPSDLASASTPAADEAAAPFSSDPAPVCDPSPTSAADEAAFLAASAPACETASADGAHPAGDSALPTNGDSAGHRFGGKSPRVRFAVESVDSSDGVVVDVGESGSIDDDDDDASAKLVDDSSSEDGDDEREAEPVCNRTKKASAKPSPPKRGGKRTLMQKKTNKPADLTKQTNRFSHMFSKGRKGMVLYDYTQYPRAKLYPTLEMAMEACLKLKNGRGVTYEPDIKAYTIRKAKVLVKSRIPEEISWARL